jgi:hypothetical protein
MRLSVKLSLLACEWYLSVSELSSEAAKSTKMCMQTRSGPHFLKVRETASISFTDIVKAF